MTRILLTSVDGAKEVDGMLSRQVAILAAAAGMTFTTCCTIFKWDNIKRDAGHGTMFMVFFCWFFWSIATLWRTILVYMNDKLDSLENIPIRHITFMTEAFFNAISMWFIVAAYEYQHRALSTRTEKSHRNFLIAYMLVIGGLTFATLIALVVIDRSGTTVQGYDKKNATEAEAYSAIILEKISWGSWLLRCLAVVYPALVALYLHFRRDRLLVSGLPRALSLIVLFFFLLNTPYLILDPLFFLEIIDANVDQRFLGLMKAFCYASGIAMSIVMGLSVRSFDSYYSTKKSRVLYYDRNSLFALSDCSE